MKIINVGHHSSAFPDGLTQTAYEPKHIKQSGQDQVTFSQPRQPSVTKTKSSSELHAEKQQQQRAASASRHTVVLSVEADAASEAEVELPDCRSRRCPHPRRNLDQAIRRPRARLLNRANASSDKAVIRTDWRL